MKAYLRITVLFAVCMSYLFLGALIFSAIEGNHEETTRVALNNSIADFLDEHPTVSFEDLMELLQSIKYAADQGISPDVMATKSNVSTQWVWIEKPGCRNWDLSNAFFFSATVVTTIGYGNLAPSTKLGRNICVLYAFVGIPFIGWLLAEVAILCRNKGRRIGEKIHNKVFFFIPGDKLRRVLTGVVMFSIGYSVIIILPAVSFSYIEQWDFNIAHYFCFVTLSTIGFGDFVATGQYIDKKSWRWTYKIGTVLYFIVGLASLAVVLNSMQQRQQRNAKKIKAAFGRKSTNRNAGESETRHMETASATSDEEGAVKTDEMNGRHGDGDVVKESAV